MMESLKVLITFHLAPDLVEKVQAADPRVEIIYEPELLGQLRYPNDQHGGPVDRSTVEERRWLGHLSRADVIFGYLKDNYASRIGELAPKLRWIQSPSAGIGQMVKRTELTETDIILTTSSGMHATPLAEFCLMAMLMHAKDYAYMAREKDKRHWARTSTTELRTKTLAVVGLGRVGREVARLGSCIGMRVIGTKRHTEGVDPASVNVEELHPWTDLRPMLGQADYVVLICPHTEETHGLIGEAELAAMKERSVLINIARGSIVDEPALIRALQSGHLGGLASDVFWKEPLPPESPFWDMPNVIISPHSASTADTENAKLTEIFVDNIHRYLEGKPMRNLLDKKALY
jgi:phosphoglycerate dehydrogenase-like enzyme